MTNAELNDLGQRISAAGGKPGVLNAALVAAIAAGALPPEGNPITDAILKPLRELSAALEHVQDWRKAQLVLLKSAPALKPGQEVVDVGTAGAPSDDGLVPLAGADLADLIRVVYSAQYNADLAARLGANYTDYVNKYGPDGRWYSPTMMVLAINPAIRRTYPSPRVWGERNGLYNARDLPEQWEGFEPVFAGGNTLPLPT